MDDEIWYPDYITLGPGGIRGLYMAGILQAMKNEGRLRNVKGYGTSSVGSCIALMTIIGYDPMEIVTAGVDTPLFVDFFSVKLGERMNEMRENIGLVSNNDIRRHLEDIVKGKLGHIPTLHELYIQTGIELYISTYNVTDEKVEILSYLTEPDISCVIAVMLSINIPFLFYQLTYNDKVYVDAALIYPLVISPFDDGINKVMVIFVDVKNTNNGNINQGNGINFTSYIHKLLMSPVKRLREIAIANTSPSCRHLCIVSSFTDLTGTSISTTDKSDMVICGMRAGQKFIEKVDDPRYKYLHMTSNMDENNRINSVQKRVFSFTH